MDLLSKLQQYIQTRSNQPTTWTLSVQKGAERIVTLLIQSGANVNTTGGQYGSAIQAASYEGREDIVALLIQSGANVNVRGKFGSYISWSRIVRYQSALSLAREKGHDGIVKLLEDVGAIDFNDLVDEELEDYCNDLGDSDHDEDD